MDLDQILQCVNDEPELPGEPPQEMKNVLQTVIIEKDVDLLAEYLRFTVRLTKQCIAERITKAFNGSQKDAAAETNR